MRGYDVDVLVLDTENEPVDGVSVKVELHEGNAVANRPP